MLNIFQKLLKEELGLSKYKDYLEQYTKMDQMRKKNGEKIKISGVYEDIYESLKEIGIEDLLRKQQRLKDTMMTVFLICKNYIFVVAAYVIAALLIIYRGVDMSVNFGCVLVLSAAFLYKTYEFVVNKYSYLDAYIIIAYKAALEKLLSETIGE